MSFVIAKHRCGSMACVIKPLRKVSFVYDGLSKYLVLEPPDIEAVLITRDHLFVYYCDKSNGCNIPDTCVVGSGCYQVYGERGPGFVLYLRYCERDGTNCLRFYIDSERNRNALNDV